MSHVETAVFAGEVVLFDTKTSLIHQLNATAAAVWLLCDGETDVTTMTAELAELFGGADLSDHVVSVLQSLSERNLLQGSDDHQLIVAASPPELLDGGRVIGPPPDG